MADNSENKKVARINEIREQGKEPLIEILVHGIEDEKTALKVESSVIDLIGKDNLTNKVSGWQSGIFGRMNLDQISSTYEKDEAKITEPGILIKINQTFRYGMSDIELYDVTRSAWKLGIDKDLVKYAFAIYNGVIQEVYEVLDWYTGGSTLATRKVGRRNDRWEFIGRIADANIRNKYLYKSVELYISKHQNPITYVNIKES